MIDKINLFLEIIETIIKMIIETIIKHNVNCDIYCVSGCLNVCVNNCVSFILDDENLSFELPPTKLLIGCLNTISTLLHLFKMTLSF